jgi:hypothetical protein
VRAWNDDEAAMNEQIFETVITTQAADGTPHIAPMGVRYEGEHVVLLPFKPSTTLANVLAGECAVLNVVVDTRVFAGCITGRKRDWPLLPAAKVAGVHLANALGHVELRLAETQDHEQRPRLLLARVNEARHAPFIGFNRAQAAVIEGAVLVSRLHMLARDKVEREMAYLQIAIDKTAGAAEHEAWRWLQDAVAAYQWKEGA